MEPMNFRVGRDLLIRAQLETVWRYFEDTVRFARWWGDGSSIQARAGGAVRICYPDGSTASGEILEWKPKNRIVFTFGYDDPAKPIAPAGGRIGCPAERSCILSGTMTPRRKPPCVP